MYRFSMRWALTLALLTGCGGAEEGGAQTAEARSTSGDETQASRSGGVAITGILGTIRQDQVEDTLNPRMNRFMRCFADRMGEVEYLGGNIHLSFRIHRDGSVAWIFPDRSDIGDRAAEQCILEVASAIRFPRPQGGEAEFEWGFGLDPAEDIRPPTTWAADALGDRADDVGPLARECRATGGGYSVTAYVQPGGAVLAAGGTMPDAESGGVLDCVLEGVRAWEMPDPGSYAAKITFEVR